MSLVKIPNSLNNISFKGLTEKEINIFFTILFKANLNETHKVSMSCLELKRLSNGDCHSERFIKSIKTTFEKLLYLTREFETCDRTIISCIFTDIIFDETKSQVTIIINKNFRCFGRDLEREFTAFQLENLISIKGTYSKNMFRLLQQFKTTKIFIIDILKFKKLLGIPVSYSFSKIDQRVLKPIQKELSKFFYGLKIKKIKTGKTIQKIEFLWSSKSIKKARKTTSKVPAHQIFKPSKKLTPNFNHRSKELIEHLKTLVTSEDLQNFKLKHDLL